jgi:hypothetical protein
LHLWEVALTDEPLTRVVIAEDDPIFMELLRHASVLSGCEVVGEPSMALRRLSYIGKTHQTSCCSI